MGVSLSKGGNVSLTKEAPGMTKAVIGLGWDSNSFTGSEFDLDAQAIMVGANGKVPNDGFFVFFNQLKSPEGSVEHTGDNRTGAGDGDDEVIVVDLTTVPAAVATLVFTVNSFTGQDFSQVENAVCRLVDAAQPQEVELARYQLTGSGRHNAQVMAKLTRDGSGWAMTAIGETASGRTFRDLLPAVTPHL